MSRPCTQRRRKICRQYHQDSDQTFEIMSPATGEAIGEAARRTAGDIDLAVDAAQTPSRIPRGQIWTAGCSDNCCGRSPRRFAYTPAASRLWRLPIPARPSATPLRRFSQIPLTPNFRDSVFPGSTKLDVSSQIDLLASRQIEREGGSLGFRDGGVILVPEWPGGEARLWSNRKSRPKRRSLSQAQTGNVGPCSSRSPTARRRGGI